MLNLWKLWERFKRVDPVFSLGGYVVSGFSLAGLTVGAAMAWLTAQLTWFWGTFQLAGVLFIGVVTWLLVGIGLRLYRQPSTIQRQSPLDPLLVVAGLAAVVLVGALVAYGLKAPSTEAGVAKAETTPIAKPVLTDDDRRFRYELRSFSLSSLNNVLQTFNRTFAMLRRIDRERNEGTAELGARERFIHFAISTGDFGFERIRAELSKPNSDDIDADALQKLIKQYFDDYRQFQQHLAQLNGLLGVDLSKTEEMQRWLEADKQARIELQKLRAWPQAKPLRDIPDGVFASVDAAWAQPPIPITKRSNPVAAQQAAAPPAPPPLSAEEKAALRMLIPKLSGIINQGAVTIAKRAEEAINQTAGSAIRSESRRAGDPKPMKDSLIALRDTAIETRSTIEGFVTTNKIYESELNQLIGGTGALMNLERAADKFWNTLDVIPKFDNSFADLIAAHRDAVLTPALAAVNSWINESNQRLAAKRQEVR